MMSDNTQKATRSSLGACHDPNRPVEGDAVVYGLVTTFDPERIVYVGMTTQHPAARLLTHRHPVPKADLRYIILWAGARDASAGAEREWIERLRPVWNTNGGGAGGRGHTIDAAEALRLYEEGLSLREVADVLGCHHGTVGKAIPPEKRRKQGFRYNRRVDIPPDDLARLLRR